MTDTTIECLACADTGLANDQPCDECREADYQAWVASEEQDAQVREFVADQAPSLGVGADPSCVLVHPDGASEFYRLLDGELNCDEGGYGDPLDVLATMDATDRAVLVAETLMAVDAILRVRQTVEDRVR